MIILSTELVNSRVCLEFQLASCVYYWCLSHLHQTS